MSSAREFFISLAGWLQISHMDLWGSDDVDPRKGRQSEKHDHGDADSVNVGTPWQRADEHADAAQQRMHEIKKGRRGTGVSLDLIEKNVGRVGPNVAVYHTEWDHRSEKYNR